MLLHPRWRVNNYSHPFRATLFVLISQLLAIDAGDCSFCACFWTVRHRGSLVWLVLEFVKRISDVSAWPIAASLSEAILFAPLGGLYGGPIYSDLPAFRSKVSDEPVPGLLLQGKVGLHQDKLSFGGTVIQNWYMLSEFRGYLRDRRVWWIAGDALHYSQPGLLCNFIGWR